MYIISSMVNKNRANMLGFHVLNPQGYLLISQFWNPSFDIYWIYVYCLWICKIFDMILFWQYFFFDFFRGVKATSLSILEVVVACEVAETGSIDESESQGTTTIYLHLKKYFRGTRFTFYSFLKSIAEKHKVGDIVCVSGKVSLWIVYLIEIFVLQIVAVFNSNLITCSC